MDHLSANAHEDRPHQARAHEARATGHSSGAATGASAVSATGAATGASAVAASKAARALSSPAVLLVPARSIVVVVPNSLGDVLLCLPALAALREGFPGAHFWCVARPAVAPIVCAAHLVDEVLERPRGGLSAQAGLMLKLHAHKPDIAVAFSSTRNAVMLAWSSGAPVRAGFEESKMEALLTHRARRNGPPRIEAFLELARELGCKATHLDPCGMIEPGPAAHLAAQSLLDEAGVPGRFVLAAPAGPDTRLAPGWEGASPNWSQAVRALALSWPVVTVGLARRGRARASSRPSSRPSSRAEPEASPAQALSDRHPTFDLGERIDVLALASLCARAALFVGPEGGLLHLASAMHTPVVGIYNSEGKSRGGKSRGGTGAASRAGRIEPRGPRRIVSAQESPLQVLAAARDLIGL